MTELCIGAEHQIFLDEEVDRLRGGGGHKKAQETAQAQVVLHVGIVKKEKLEGLVYGDNVFEKDGIRRDRTGDGEKTRCLCGKRGIFNRDGPAMGPQIIRQLE